MAESKPPRELESLDRYLQELPASVARYFSGYLIRLHMLRQQIEEECPKEVESATAFGKFLDPLESPSRRPLSREPRNGLEILVVTTLTSVYEAHEILGEKVFGPMLLEFARLPQYHIWTRREAKIAEDTGHDLWRWAKQRGVTVYGRPLGANGAGESLSRDR